MLFRSKVEARRGGILLFHDIKEVAARALPILLAELKARGYRVVHMTSKTAFVPDRQLLEEYRAQVTKTLSRRRDPAAAAAAQSVTSPLAAHVLGGVPLVRVPVVHKAFGPAAVAQVPQKAIEPEAPQRPKWRTRVRRRRDTDSDD